MRTEGALEVTDPVFSTTGAGLGSGMDAGCAETVGVLGYPVALGIKPAGSIVGEKFGAGTRFEAGMNPGGGERGDLAGDNVAGEVGGEDGKVFSSGFDCLL